MNAKSLIRLESAVRATYAVVLTMLLCAAVPSPAQGCGISGDDGSYKRSCQNCSTTGTILSCDCVNKQRFPVHTSIDLSDCRSDPQDPLSNNDGRLVCRHCSVPGACCLPDASCAIKTFTECDAGGIFKGDNTCANVICPQQTEIHWTNPDGGDFGVADNWDPQQVPTFTAQRSDTAVFDLTGRPLPITIHATNNAVGRWIIRHMGVHLDGQAQVLGTATDDFKFIVDDGGTLVLDDGATFATNDAVVGNLKGVESSVFVSGTQTNAALGPLAIGFRAPGRVVVDHDGVLDAQKSITIGDSFAGTLDIDGGGHVTTPNLTLNQGSIQVRGRGTVTDSSLKIDSDLDIGGQDGSGSVTIEGGAGITAQRVLVGDRAATGGETVTISGVDNSGASSTLGSDGELHVAGNAATQIEVKDGGVLSTLGKARVGDNLAVGKVIVHGTSGTTHASWDAFDDVFVGGRIVASKLIVEDGGHVKGSKQMVLGLLTGDIGSASVSGNESRLEVGTLVVGRVGHGELAISGGALAKSTTGIVGFSQLDPGQGGGAGSGLVTIEGSIFSPFVSQWHVTGDCFVGTDEPGTVKLQGRLEAAQLRVDGTLTVGTQGVIEGSGTLTAGRMFNDGVVDPGTLTVGTPGVIEGSGALRAGPVFNDGLVASGLSPGVITIDGEYEQTPDGALRIEAAGLEPGQFDVLHITGNATLAGKLELRFIDGYLPKAGDSFDFLQVGGTIAGAFAQMTFPNLAPGFDADLSTTPDGKLRLTALADGVLRCGGDCDSSGDVTVNEVITLVNVALGTGTLATCEAGDGNGDQQITINEIVIAVNNALTGCR